MRMPTQVIMKALFLRTKTPRNPTNKATRSTKMGGRQLRQRGRKREPNPEPNRPDRQQEPNLEHSLPQQLIKIQNYEIMVNFSPTHKLREKIIKNCFFLDLTSLCGSDPVVLICPRCQMRILSEVKKIKSKFSLFSCLVCMCITP